MTQVFSDGALVYDSRLPRYELLGLSLDVGLNKGGAAYIQMPPGHPAFNAFTSYKTIVEVYRNGALLFRGRALYPADDFLHRRTITSEGERCFFNDAVIRPYSYQTTPAQIFEDVVGRYNAQVDAFKRFTVGEITVTTSDPSGQITLENDSAESAGAVLDKLIERCGGYIVFSGTPESRRVNWLAELDYISGQTIDFGENLLDFARTDESADLVTVLVPFGALDENGNRTTIESVNAGKDYIEDAEAIQLRGRVARAVYFDEITDPGALLAQARKYLDAGKKIITSLTLTAVDLSVLDKTIDSFIVGDQIRVRSAPHGVDDLYQLTARSYDLLHPEKDRVTLGKSVASLSAASAQAEKSNAGAIQRSASDTREGADVYAQGLVSAAEDRMTGRLSDTEQQILVAVAGQYATLEQLGVLSSEVSADFSYLLGAFEAHVAEADANFTQIRAYIAFGAGSMIPSGANLNDYRTPGVFGIATDAIAQTLVNTPYKTAGVLRVFLGDGVQDPGTTATWHLVQEYQPSNSSKAIARRTLTRSTAGTWTYGSWYASIVTVITPEN